MALNIMESTKWVRNRAMVCMSGTMGLDIKVFGTKTGSKDLESTHG